MDLKLKVSKHFCSPDEFIINGVEAACSDFGDKYDDDPHAEDYGCGNMIFTPYELKNNILEKYKINKKEYYKICDELETELSFGACGWCA